MLATGCQNYLKPIDPIIWTAAMAAVSPPFLTELFFQQCYDVIYSNFGLDLNRDINALDVYMYLVENYTNACTQVMPHKEHVNCIVGHELDLYIMSQCALL